MDEFDLISRYFDHEGDQPGVVVGVGDDGAVLTPDPAKQQVQVIDTLVEGVHFPADTKAADIAYRAVAVNLSDIAAMGAHPRWMTLALSLSDSSEKWVASFSSGLLEAANQYKVALVGGDTTSGPIVTVTVTITGEVETGAALLRCGAKVGDRIFVSGTLGDAAAGLAMLQGGKSDDFLTQRFLRPTPRVTTGRALLGKANSTIDISDGCVGDLKKLLTASGVGGEIDIDKLPLSESLRERFSEDEQQHLALCGGDDYELCFTAPREAVQDIPGITEIGYVHESAGLVCRRNGDIVEIDDSGYRHFQ